jgi:transposase
LSEVDFSGITAIGMDETSRRKGHKYITVFADIDTGRIVHICPGKDASTLKSFSKSLDSHNSSPDRIINFCCDMSPVFISGISEHFPSSSITFDKFHISKIVNEVVDEVRRFEQMFNRILKNTRYIWLKNPSF